MSAAESPAELLERLAWEREHLPRFAPDVHIAISGGRDRTPAPAEIDAFWALWERLQGTVLHHGDSPNPLGTDRYVGRLWEQRTGRKAVKHPADWKGLGKAAGPIRSREMMTQCAALIAFPGDRGTRACIRTTREQGKPVYFVGKQAEPPLPPAGTRPGQGARTVRRQRPAPEPEDEPDRCHHARVDWTWWPSRAAWLGRCYRCGKQRWATAKEAASLEQAAAQEGW